MNKKLIAIGCGILLASIGIICVVYYYTQKPTTDLATNPATDLATNPATNSADNGDNKLYSTDQKGLPQSSTTLVDSLISEQLWISAFPWGPQGPKAPETFECHWNIKRYQNTYSYNNFIEACKYFPTFASGPNGKRELAAFLGNVAHETTGTGYSKTGGGLCYIAETPGCFLRTDAEKDENYQGTDTCYTLYDDKNHGKGPNGVSYFGRGALQITHDYNYGDFSMWLYGDKNVLLNNPEYVSVKDGLAFLSALWFWMLYKDAEMLKETCHEQFVKNKPFENTIIIINGMECKGDPNKDQQALDRVNNYKLFCDKIGISPEPIYNTDIKCQSQQTSQQTTQDLPKEAIVKKFFCTKKGVFKLASKQDCLMAGKCQTDTDCNSDEQCVQDVSYGDNWENTCGKL